MSLLEELQDLDLNDIGRWPFLFRAAAVAITFVIATSGGVYYFVYEEKTQVLEAAQAKEADLRVIFEEKQRKAANFDAYQEQLEEIERSFGAMLRQLPGKTEIPNLLVDISQTGLAAGLKEKLFQPMGEVKKDFYAEKPIKIKLDGSFHEFGSFVSDIAGLPRIVTIHDIAITPVGKDGDYDDLILDLTAKTYRYMDDDQIDEAS